jgi:pilus assembly protein Flp/PilA
LYDSVYSFLAGRLLRDENGQGMLEYALVITFVALIVISALFILGPKVGNLFNEAGNQLIIR